MQSKWKNDKKTQHFSFEQVKSIRKLFLCLFCTIILVPYLPINNPLQMKDNFDFAIINMHILQNVKCRKTEMYLK